MPQYVVSWNIDVEAETPEEAAEAAFGMMQDPETLATFFHVKEAGKGGKGVTVDLRFEDQKSQTVDLDTGEVTHHAL